MFSSQRLSYPAQFALLGALFIAGFFTGSVIVVVIVKLLLHVPLGSMESVLANQEHVQLSRILQAVSTFFYMAVPSFIFASCNGAKPLVAIGFSRSISRTQLLLIILIAFASLFASGAFAELNQSIPIPQNAAKYFKSLEDDYNKAVLAIANMRSVSDYVISLIVLAFLPALFEEMFFRGCLQQVIIGWAQKAFIGILITSIFFSAIHFSYYGFLPRLFLGMVLGYIFYYSRNIWLSIFAHFLNNAFTVTQLYSLSKAGKLNADSMDDNFPLYYGIAATALVFFLFWFFRKESNTLFYLDNLKRSNSDEGMV